jgi:phenylacetic acid degradation operon negative regulatory protein
MKPKTEEFLYLLLWTADSLLNPSWRNLNNSFESWAYSNGFLQQLRRLERQQVLERRGERLDERLIRLTETGRLHALGGRDPLTRWARSWDGRWRMILFDVPEEESFLRHKLRRFLQKNNFGCLQKSVWITPDDLTPLRKTVFPRDDQSRTFLCFEGRPCGGENDRAIVRAAWNFEDIHALYKQHQSVLTAFPMRQKEESDTDYVENLLLWGTRERAAWKRVMEADPLLPACLLPRGYPGKQAWSQRAKALRRAGEALLQMDLKLSHLRAKV